jgi:hypothetical protein
MGEAGIMAKKIAMSRSGKIVMVPSKGNQIAHAPETEAPAPVYGTELFDVDAISFFSTGFIAQFGVRTVSWGDGNQDTGTGEFTHDYAIDGPYTVEITSPETLASLNSAGLSYAPITKVYWDNLPGITSIFLTEFSLPDYDMLKLPNATSVWFQNNGATQAQIDQILADLVTNGLSNGDTFLTGNTAPSAAGDASVLTLIGRGWTVTTD